MAKAFPIICALAAALAVVPQAFADGNPPPNPSIAQYVEQVPTSEGAAVPSSVPPKRTTHVKLAPHVEHQLPQTPEGAALKTIATSPTYGAPQRKLHVTKKAAKKVAVVAKRAVMEPKSDVSGATLSAAVDAVGAQRTLVVWLGLVLFSTAALGIGSAVARARR
jgi:hypothetical protein